MIIAGVVGIKLASSPKVDAAAAEHGLGVLRDAVPVYETALRQALNRSAADPRLAPLVEQLNAMRG